MIKDVKPGLGGDESQLSSNTAIKWPGDYRERLNQNWSLHTLPVKKTISQWEQTVPIPVFHWVQTSFDGTVSVHHLRYLFNCNKLGVNTAGRTLKDAETQMRKSLPFNIELGKGRIHRITPTAPEVEMANEISQYFKQKPEEPQE